MENLSAKVTGSAFYRIANCPGSVALSLGLPDEQEKEYAAEGTLAHEVAANILQGNINTSELEEDMLRHVTKYVEYVKSIGDGILGPYELLVERRFNLYPDDPNSPSGQIDALIIHKATQTAWIVDLKYGVGAPVSAVGNYQMAFYAVLVRENFPFIKTIHTTIVQPRVIDVFDTEGVITSVTLKYQTIDAWKRKIEEVVRDVQTKLSIEAGQWCQFCPAKGRCPAYISAASLGEEASQKFELANIVPGELTTDEIKRIAHLFSLKKRITDWLTKAEELLLGLALEGKEIPGFALTDKRANRQWDNFLSEEEVAAKLKERGIEEPYTKKLMSPAQAEKICDVSDLWIKPEAGKTLKAIK